MKHQASIFLHIQAGCVKLKTEIKRNNNECVGYTTEVATIDNFSSNVSCESNQTQQNPAAIVKHIKLPHHQNQETRNPPKNEQLFQNKIQKINIEQLRNQSQEPNSHSSVNPDGFFLPSCH